jgi:hypothetical protein
LTHTRIYAIFTPRNFELFNHKKPDKMKTVAVVTIVFLIIFIILIIWGVLDKVSPPHLPELVKALGFAGIIAAILSLHKKE